MPERNPREIQQALAQPFAPEDLEWRLQNTIEDKMRGMAVPYAVSYTHLGSFLWMDTAWLATPRRI